MYTFFMKLSCNSLGDCRDISYLAFVLLKLFSCLQWMIEISANILCTRCLALVQKLNRHLHKHTNCTQLWSFEQKGIHIRCTKSWISQIALLVFCIVRNLSVFFSSLNSRTSTKNIRTNEIITEFFTTSEFKLCLKLKYLMCYE